MSLQNYIIFTDANKRGEEAIDGFIKTSNLNQEECEIISNFQQINSISFVCKDCSKDKCHHLDELDELRDKISEIIQNKGFPFQTIELWE